MLAAEVGQLLQTVCIGKKVAKPFHRHIVPFFRAVAALPVVSSQFIQLCLQAKVNILCFHMSSFPMDIVSPVANSSVSTRFP